jgi:Leucine-rich repeat (LRR) protein
MSLLSTPQAKFWSSYFLQFQCRDTLNHASLIIDATFGPREELGLSSMGSSSSSASSSAPAIQAIRSSSPTLLSPLPSPSPSWASPMTETSDTLLSFTDSPRSSQSPLSLSTASTDEDSSASSASWAAQQTDSSCSQRGSVSALSSQTSSASSSLIVPALNLARKGLHSIPAELSATDDRRFGHMTGLNLSNNILSYFSFLVAHLRQLEVLNLSTNEFREIPELLAQSFVELTRLRELDISHNKIYRLPAQLSLLTNLQRLEASHNRLLYTQQGDEATSERLWGLSGDGGATATRHTLASFDFAPLADSLEYLSISYNSPKAKHAPSGGAAASSRCSASLDLHLFPRSLLALTHLTTLKFHGNNIPYLPPNFFATFKRLQDLDMGDNAITILPSGLGGLQLTSLNINNIELKELMPQEVFQVCTHSITATLCMQLIPHLFVYILMAAGWHAAGAARAGPAIGQTAAGLLGAHGPGDARFVEQRAQRLPREPPHALQPAVPDPQREQPHHAAHRHQAPQESREALPQEERTRVPRARDRYEPPPPPPPPRFTSRPLGKDLIRSHAIGATGFCKALGVLDISDNKIKELPPQLGALPRLRYAADASTHFAPPPPRGRRS